VRKPDRLGGLMSTAAPALVPPREIRPTSDLAAAYRHCWQIATTHYENFTLGSWLLPKPLRQHIAAIYAFARTADDFADEGTIPAPERLANLRSWSEALDACYAGRATNPIFVALGETVRTFDLPIDPFRNLLRAFVRDVEFRPFETFAELLEYCRCSADPVGHLILYLFGYRDAERQALANQICTGLQLANFWQDVTVDAEKGRVYFPTEDLRRFGCTADEIRAGAGNERVRALMQLEVNRARSLLTSGLQLANCVERRLGREVALFAWGGLTILDAIEQVDFDVVAHRPTVSKWAKLKLVIRAFGSTVGAQHVRPSSQEAL